MIYTKAVVGTKLLILASLFLFLISVILFQRITLKIKQRSLNLVIISIDTLRTDHMGVYGYNKDTTPNIDKWAKDALVFKNVRTVIPMTHPSFSALMTGKDPFKTRIVTNRGLLVSNNSKTLATILNQNGYKTAAFTTGALNPLFTNLNQGLDEDDYLFFKSYYFQNNQEIYYQEEREEYEDFLDKAVDFLDKNKKFSLWIHLMDPHRPYQPPDDLKCQFNQKFCDYINSKTPEELEAEIVSNQLCQNREVPKEKVEIAQTLYDGGVAYSDRLVGKILNALEEKGLNKNTLVILYGDHGEGFDHNYYFNHRGVLYESAIKIPLIIKNPLSRKNGTFNRYIQNTDILPAILDYLGINYDGKVFDGRSPNRILSNFQAQAKDEYFMNSALNKFAIFDGRYKFIYSLPESCLLNGQTEELYDIKNDPEELKNLVDDKKEVVVKLKTRLLEYLAYYNLPPASQRSPQRTNEQPWELPY